MGLKNYIHQRKKEILKRSNDEEIKMLLTVGWNFIEDRITERFKEVTPEAVRKVELLEILLSNFISHGLDLEKLNEIEDQIKNIGVPVGRQIQ
jgi:hypothetical protein